MNKEKIGQYCLYLWLLAWPWQTKLILRSSDINYLEISFFISWLLLLVPFILWGRKILTDYWKIEKAKPLWWWGLIMWELMTFISIFFAEDKSQALFRYLILLAGIFLFYLVKRIVFNKNKLQLFFISGLLLPAILGIFQFFTQKVIVSKYLGLAYHSAGTLGDSVIETVNGRFLRAYGPFDHPNVLGGVMVIGLLLILYSCFKKEIGRDKRLFYFSSFCLLYAALLVSFSRAALSALFLGGIFLIMKFRRRGFFQKKIISFFIFLTICISAAVIIPYKDLFFVRVQAQSRLEKKSIEERETYLKQAFDIIIQKPIQGVGAGNYILAEKKIDNDAHPAWYYQPVHNYWLLAWAEIGIFGLLGVLIFWFSLTKASLRKYSWTLVLVLFILSLLDHWLWTWPLGIIFSFLIGGLIAREDF